MIAVGYVRLSPGERKSKGSSNFSGVSVENQIESIQRYCDFRQYNLMNTFIDDERSGKNLDRPEFIKMNALLDELNALRKPKTKNPTRLAELGLTEIDGITLVVAKLDRLGRNMIECVTYFNELTDKDIHFASLKEGQEIFNSQGAQGTFIRNIFLSLGQLERELISERTTETLAYLRDHEKVFCNKTPLGWMRQDKQLVPNEKERAYVRYFVKLRQNGCRMSFIAHQFTREGIATRNGTEWSRERLKSLEARINRMPEQYKWVNDETNNAQVVSV